MRKWYTPAMAVVGCALLAVPLLAFARPDEKVEDDTKDKAQARRELKDLEEQRAKLDGRIRELRRKAGIGGAQAFTFGEGAHAFTFGDGKLAQIEGLDGEQKIIIEKALSGAHKSVEEALKNIPNFEKFNFDFDDKDNKALKLFIDKDGKQYKWDNKMSEEDKRKFKEQMEKMHIELRENMKGLKELKNLKIEIPEIHTIPDVKVYTPRANSREYRVVEPRERAGGSDSSDLRNEIRSLRDEVSKLRDEVKRGRGGKPDAFDEVKFL